MSMLQGAAFVANGNINPSTFVSLNGNFQVIAAVANDPNMIGISQPGTDTAPGVIGSGNLAAKSGETLQIYGPGDVCLLKVTSAVVAGQFLESDANAQGITNISAAVVHYIGAKALESANAGELCRVVVILGGITQT